MIFVTIGTQIPFDRLIEAIDSITPEIDEEIIAQTLSGTYVPKNIKTVEFLEPEVFKKYIEDARVIMGHAGMGVILSAMEHNKPLIIFARDPNLGEVLNSHQIATAAKMAELGYAYTANTTEELKALLSDPDLKPLHSIGAVASDSLIESLTDFIEKI